MPTMENEQYRHIQNEFSQSEYFQNKLNDILQSKLTPDNVDEYTETALSLLINLSNEVTTCFKKDIKKNFANLSEGEIEDLAFEHYKIQNISEILDQIHNITYSLKDIDHRISNIPECNLIIVPPDKKDITLYKRNGVFEERKEIPRLKILLFLLKENLGIDINDSNELTIVKGKVDSNMMRISPYYAVKILSLNRTVLICDQIGNVTFVLDNNLLYIQDNELLNLTKDELKNFIEFNENLGRMIRYSKNYIQDIIFALTNKLSQSNTNPETLFNVNKYLYPKPIHNTLSIRGMSTLFGISRRTISKVIEELQEDLGETQKYRFSTIITDGYTLEQQEKIKQGLEARGLFTEKVPENILNIKGMSTLFGISTPTISKVIEELQEDLGKVQKYSFGQKNVVTHGYTLEQQEKIKQGLEARGLFTEKAPNDILSIKEISTLFGISTPTISKVIEELQEDLGKVQKYNFYSKNVLTDGYTLEQQEKIKQGLKTRGLFSEKAPENILSIRGMTTLFGISTETISKIIEELQEDLGEVQKYRFRSKITDGYTLEQQEKIRQVLKDKGLFSEKAPENILSTNRMSTLFGISNPTISKIIKELQEDLGEVQKYSFGTRITYGYTLEQQEKIRQAIQQKNKKNI